MEYLQTILLYALYMSRIFPIRGVLTFRLVYRNSNFFFP